MMAGLPSEFELIAKYFAPLARAFPNAYGLLDDAAVISPAPGGAAADRRVFRQPGMQGGRYPPRE